MAQLSARCRVKNCINNSSNYNGGFFRFPKNRERAQQWATLCDIVDVFNASSNHTMIKICGAHFQPQMFSTAETPVRRRLKPTAYPTLFEFLESTHSDSLAEVTEPNCSTRIIEQSGMGSVIYMDTSRPGPSTEHCYSEKQQLISMETGPDSDDDVAQVSEPEDIETLGCGILNPDDSSTSASQSTPSTSKSTPSTSKSTPSTSKSTPSMSKSTPSTVNFQCQTPKQLTRTPRKLAYRVKIKSLQKKVRSLQTQVKQKPNKSSSNSEEKKLFLELADKFLTKEQSTFVKMQVLSDSRSVHGRRYTMEFKKLCLGLYFKGPKAYRQLATIFTLPSKRTLNSMTQNIVLEPGIHEKMFLPLQSKINEFSSLDRYCILTIDEMSLKAHVFYNITQDEIIGFEDFGEGKNLKPALYATVFMLRGISSNWKQPVGYYFVNTSCKVSTIQKGIEKIVSYARNVGLNVCLLITDQGSNFTSLANLLGVSSNKPYFCINEHKIVYIFDSPHLLKSVRNNFMKYSFTFENKHTSWDYIKKFYYVDKEKNNRYAHRLTEQHINPSGFDKMKVKYAAQVLSATVAAGMEVHVAYGNLPEEAMGTVEVISFFDKLFDVFNSRNLVCPKMYNKVFKNEEHQNTFLVEAFNFLSNLKIVDPTGRNRSGSIKCIAGWMQSIKGLMELWNDLSPKGFEFLKTNRINQDCLENFFGSIRQQGGNSVSPTPIQFTRAFKKHFVMDFMHSGTENCENDFSDMLSNMGELVNAAQIHEETEAAEQSAVTFFKNTTDCYELDPHEQNSLQYVCGYLIKKCLSQHTCSTCENFANAKDFVDEKSIFTHLKAYDKSKPFGQLKMPQDIFYYYVSGLESIFFENFEICAKKHVLHNLITFYKSHDLNHPCEHFPKSYLVKLYARMRLYYTLKFINKNLKDTSDKTRRKLIIWKHV